MLQDSYQVPAGKRPILENNVSKLVGSHWTILSYPLFVVSAFWHDKWQMHGVSVDNFLKASLDEDKNSSTGLSFAVHWFCLCILCFFLTTILCHANSPLYDILLL